MNLPTVNIKETGANIQRLFNANGWSIEDIQYLFGFTDTKVIRKWFNGDSLPTVDDLVILSYIFGVSINKILIIER